MNNRVRLLIVVLLMGAIAFALVQGGRSISDGVSGGGDADILASRGLRLERVLEADQPVALLPSERGTFLVVEQAGLVRRFDADGKATGTVLDVTDETEAEGEQGLLGAAVSPDGDFLYVNYTNLEGDTRVVEYALVEGVASADTERLVLAVDQPYANHNGGHLAFGPDGHLYIGLGDGGSGGDPQGRAQDPDELLGKILRISPRPEGDAPYGVPDDNPFVGDETYRPEIWATGVRNPWRYSFDSETDDLWIGDVGQNNWEEIDRIPAGEGGENLGWNIREGLHQFEGAKVDGLLDPVAEYGHTGGECSISGGVVVRGEEAKLLHGRYLFADLCTGQLSTVSAGAAVGKGKVVDTGLRVTQPVSFAVDDEGAVYVVSVAGTVYRLVER